MPDMVETYAGTGTAPWWAGKSPTAKSMVLLEGDAVGGYAMREAAGLDWTASKRRLIAEDLDARPGLVVPRWMAMVRDTDDAFLGIVKDTYHPKQNADVFDIVDTLLGESRAMHGHALNYVTGGALFGGALCWTLAKFDKDLHVRGDGSPLLDYLLAYWGHDGRHGLVFADTMVRAVCWNTVTAGINGATDKVTIRHTANMEQRIEEVRSALDIHFKYRETLSGIFGDLTRRPMTIDDVKAFTVALLPANPDSEKAWRTEAERASILDVYQNSVLLDGLHETAYRAYNAVTEYVDHRRGVRTTKTGSSDDRRALSIVEGSAYALKSRALGILVKA